MSLALNWEIGFGSVATRARSCVCVREGMFLPWLGLAFAKSAPAPPPFPPCPSPFRCVLDWFGQTCFVRCESRVVLVSSCLFRCVSSACPLRFGVRFDDFRCVSCALGRATPRLQWSRDPPASVVAPLCFV